MNGDLNIINAASLAQIHDRGEVRRGATQGDLDLISDAAIAIRNGIIVGVGTTEKILRDWGEPDRLTIDAHGKTLLPGLVDCHSHPIFDGDRHDEYALRLGGASLADVAASGGGIWRSVVASRAASDDALARRLDVAFARLLAGGVTTLEVKSGYGLTVEQELRELSLLEAARTRTPLQLVISFLGAHVVPRDLEGDAATRPDRYVDLIEHQMLPAVVKQGIAEFQDITVEAGYFTPEQALRLMRSSIAAGLAVRVHADAWASSRGWATAVAGKAVSADHLTYTPDSEILEVGRTDTIAVVLPIAELIYMTDRRANARLFIEQDVPVAVSTDYCSSIRATSLLNTIANAAPWFRLTPGEVIVGATLNAAYSLGRQAVCGSLDVGKRGDVLILDVPHPNEVCMSVGAPLLETVIVGGNKVWGT